ncbi:hypothetical protein FSP39_022810, partial [Pinctada imbricata]
VRLVDGPDKDQGRVEIQYKGTWGTICDDEWDYVDAQIVCKMMGKAFSTALPVSRARYGPGKGTILMDNVRCVGDETSLESCDFNGWGVNDWQHEEDAEHTQLTGVRLVDGPDKDQGRVEIQYKGTWGTICDDEWDYVDAQIVCKMMGKAFSTALPVSRARYGPGKGTILMDNVRCVGDETSLESCDFNGWGVNDCQHEEDAGVICQDKQLTGIRLVDGPDKDQGRVEIQYNGTWGTICDDEWDYVDAQIVCKMMGKAFSVAVPVFHLRYGDGKGPILMDNVRCVGDETSLESCDFNGWGVNNCDHSDDVGVICQDSKYISFLI